MQTWMQVLITACILSMVSSAPTLTNREQRPSKYEAQMFDCGVPGKIQVLQIPSEDSNKEGMSPTQSIRVGDSMLYGYVPQEIIRVDSQVTSCQGTQVRL